MRDTAAMPPLHSRTWGTGPLPLLALHCGLGQGGMWRDVAEALAIDCTLTAPDLPGHGRSPPFPEGEDVHDAACAVLRPWLREGLHLAGHSFGATLALRLALENPGQVASLFLIEPVFFAAAPDSPMKRDHQAAEAALYAECDAGNLALAARMFHGLWGGGLPWDDFPQRVREGMARQLPFVRSTEPALWHDRAGMLAPGGLERLAVPVTLLRGAQTLPIVAEVHRGLMSRLPQVRETVVGGAGHMVLTSHPGPVAEALAQQIAEAGSQSRAW